MKIIGNCTLITLNKFIPFVSDGAVLEDEGLIVEVGETKVLRELYPHVEFLNMNGKIVLAGFLNAHMHLYSTFARGFGFGGASPRNFLEILKNIWWKLDKNLTTEEEIYFSALVPLIEGIKSGTTSIIDHHASFGLIDGSLDILENALLKTGVRGVLAYEVSDRWGSDLAQKSIAENVRFIKKAKNSPNKNFISASFGLHASLTLSDKTLDSCAENENKLGSGFHVHVAEGIEDVDDSMKKSGKRVLERLNDFGILGDKTLAIHCVHVNDKEIHLLKETNTMVVYNPESNMNNAVGVPPTIEIDNEGITIGLGTDGYTPSMLESIKVAYILPKFNYHDPRVGGDLAKRMLFENNSKIFSNFFEHPLGIIKKGSYADLVAFDYYPPTPINEDNFFGHLIFGLRENSLNTVIINGDVVMKNHELQKIDEKEVMSKAREIAKKFWEKM